MCCQEADIDGNGILDREEMFSLIRKLGIPLKDAEMDVDFVFGALIDYQLPSKQPANLICFRRYVGRRSKQ